MPKTGLEPARFLRALVPEHCSEVIYNSSYSTKFGDFSQSIRGESYQDEQSHFARLFTNLLKNTDVF